ncbi:MAG: cobalt ECF transporter T component CbiQ [Nitrospiraceae bacterium]|nr:cobalt ECF transporter T component CbiQ [Nitrospiraceae bacterium]
MEDNGACGCGLEGGGRGKGKIDARIKLILFGFALVLIITSKGFRFLSAALAVSVASCLLMKVPFKKFSHRFPEPLFIAGVLFLIKALSGGGPGLVLHLFGLKVYLSRSGIFEGARLGLRVVAAVSALSLLTFSAPFEEILSALEWLKFPRQLVEMAFLAHRYIKVFLADAQAIYHSQKNRLGYSGMGRSLNSFGIMAGSLTIKTFEQAQATSLAMVQRGYNGKLPTGASDIRGYPGRGEFVFAGSALALMALLWIKLQ